MRVSFEETLAILSHSGLAGSSGWLSHLNLRQLRSLNVASGLQLQTSKVRPEEGSGGRAPIDVQKEGRRDLIPRHGRLFLCSVGLPWLDLSIREDCNMHPP